MYSTSLIHIILLFFILQLVSTSSSSFTPVQLVTEIFAHQPYRASSCLSSLNSSTSPPDLPALRFSIVHFAWIPICSLSRPEDPPLGIFLAQFRDLIATGIIPSSLATHVVLIGAPDCTSLAHRLVVELSSQHQVPREKLHIHASSVEGLFEFPGIHLAWALACQDPSEHHLVLYFHTKGVTHNVRRDGLEAALFHETVRPWREILAIFGLLSDAQFLGLVPATGNFSYVWYNFWWARASYASRLVEPVLHPEDRYFFEDWLGIHAVGSECPSHADDVLRNYSAILKDTVQHKPLSLNRPHSHHRYPGYSLSECALIGSDFRRLMDVVSPLTIVPLLTLWHQIPHFNNVTVFGT